jgi:hypothetical protein
LGAFHNRTGTPFLTSDNPVIWFDPTVPDEAQQPYYLRSGGEVLLLFPVSPTLILLGASNLKDLFSTAGLVYREVPDQQWVDRANLEVCRYAYKAIYASSPGQEELIQALADKSPVWQREGRGGHLVFGARAAKPKWKRRES